MFGPRRVGFAIQELGQLVEAFLQPIGCCASVVVRGSLWGAVAARLFGDILSVFVWAQDVKPANIFEE